MPELTYLDDRPVDDVEKEGSKAFFQGGYELERKVKMEIRIKKDGMTRARDQEKRIDDKVSVEERRRISSELLKNEYETRKLNLENSKRKFMERYLKEPENKMEISRELMAIDNKIEENEKYLKREGSCPSSINKRGYFETTSIFVFEEWMYPMIEMKVMLSNFDFSLACDYIRHELKSHDVKNTDLLNELDLRLKWTEIESKVFRKNQEHDSKCFDYNYEDHSVKMNTDRLEDEIKTKSLVKDEESKAKTSFESDGVRNNNLYDKKEYIKKPENNFHDPHDMMMGTYEYENEIILQHTEKEEKILEGKQEKIKNNNVESEEEFVIDTRTNKKPKKEEEKSNNTFGQIQKIKYFQELD